jgi:cubilin
VSGFRSLAVQACLILLNLPGLGSEMVYHNRITSTFENRNSDVVSPHIYCGSSLPVEYISMSSMIQIKFKSNELRNSSSFNLSVNITNACERNYTAMQGRLRINTFDIQKCKSTIRVPSNYKISLYFYAFTIYDGKNCEKNFMKIYDGSFESGTLLRTACGYTLQDPIFSSSNQLSLYFSFLEDRTFYKPLIDVLYVATDKGRGCGGEIFNYAGVFTSPLYPATNRTNYDCTWSIRVPNNLKVALKFDSEYDQLPWKFDELLVFSRFRHGIECLVRQ